MWTATRPPMERMLELDRAIRAGEYPNARIIADRLQVAPRTVQRDFEFLKERLLAPLVFVRGRNGYAYSDAGYRLPSVLLTEGELVAILIAERALRQFRGTPFAPDLERAFGKIQFGLRDPVRVDLGRLSESYSFHSPTCLPFDPSLFMTLSGAISNCRRLRLDYWTASRGEQSRRVVDPYHLANVEGEWYLIAWCHTRQRVLTFAPSRIRGVESLDESFEIPSDFKIDVYLRDSMSVMRGNPGEIHHARIRFWGLAARFVAERTWHPSQTTESRADGSLIVGLTLSSLIEVERWVLSWGSEAEVLEPAELRARVAKHARDSHARYESGTTRAEVGKAPATRAPRSRGKRSNGSR